MAEFPVLFINPQKVTTGSHRPKVPVTRIKWINEFGILKVSDRKKFLK